MLNCATDNSMFSRSSIVITVSGATRLAPAGKEAQAKWVRSAPELDCVPVRVPDWQVVNLNSLKIGANMLISLAVPRGLEPPTFGLKPKVTSVLRRRRERAHGPRGATVP